MRQNEERLRYDREHGEYWEEIEKIVDSAVDAIKSGDIRTTDALEEWLNTTLDQCAYINRSELCVLVLQYSKHPTAAFFVHGTSFAVNDTAKSEGRLPWDGGKANFPWGPLALDAMLLDCSAELAANPEFASLDLPADEDEIAAELEEDDDPEESAKGP